LRTERALIKTTRSRLAAALSAATTIASWREISLRDGYRFHQHVLVSVSLGVEITFT